MEELEDLPVLKKTDKGIEAVYEDGNDLPILKKKDFSDSTPPTGGKVGASEIPSTGNETAELLGYTKVPSPLIADTKPVKPVKSVEVEEVSIPKWGGIITDKKGANKNYTEDIASVAYNAFKRGMAQGETATELNISESGGDIDVNEIVKLQKESQRYQPSEAYKKFNNSTSVTDALKALAEEPAKVLTELSLESLTAMMNHGIVGGRMWQPAVVGAGAGSVIPGLGTAAGAASGFIAGSGLTSLNLEYSGKILETLAEEGVDTTNPESLKKAFTDEKKFSELKEAAWKKGVPIMVFDMIGAGVAGKIGGKVASKLGGNLAGKVAAGASEVAAQAALGGGGELAGEVAAGEKINPSAILAEMIGEPAGSVHEIAVGTLIENAKNGNLKKEDVTTVVANPNVQNTDVKDVVDISVGAGQITPEIGEQIKSQIDAVEEINKTVPPSIQAPEDRVTAIDLIEKRKQLEAQSEQVDEAFKPAIEQQVKAINDELLALSNKPTPEPPAFETDATEAAKPIELSTEQELLTPNTQQNEQETKIGERGTLQEPNQQVREGGQEPRIGEENSGSSRDEKVREGENGINGTEGQEEVKKGNPSTPNQTDKSYQEAQGVTERVSKAHPEASVLVLPKGDDLSLTALYVGKEKRGKGIGSGVLESVKAEADKLGKKVVLDATNELDNDTDLERLGEFYERNGFVKVGENKFEYTPKKNQLLTPNTNQNETVNENVREIGNGQKDGQKGDVSQEAKSDVQEGEEKVAEGEEPTAEQVDKASKAVGTTPSNLRDLYRISRDLFGQNRVRAFASAIAMDRMIGAMAKRAGIPKQRMYEKLQFRKASEEELPQGVKFQIDAWHGSPYQFDRFTTLKIGTGEGAQAFGWGLYFTDLEGIARNYAKNLAILNLKTVNEQISSAISKFKIKTSLPENYNWTIVSDILIANDLNIDKAIDFFNKSIEEKTKQYNDPAYKYNADYLLYSIKELQEELKVLIGLKENNMSFKPPGRVLYKVTLHKGRKPSEYKYLEWGKPIKDETILNNLLAEIGKLKSKSNQLMFFEYDLKKAQENKEIKDRLLNYTGEELYNRLARSLSPKEASLLLLNAGIDGIKYPAESISRGATSDTARGFNYVVFDENAVSIEEVIKFQKDAEKARGAMMMALDGQAIIYALSDPNVSTPLHELAHVFEHYLTESERQTIIRNAGTGAWTTETSEYFARGFEKYLAEGVAPNKELQKVFEKFKEWLTEIYNGITGSEIDIQLNDEMRAIYAQMFGEEEVNSKFKPNETTQKEDGKPLPEGVSGVRTETEERKTSPELRPQKEEVRSTIDNAVANFYAINEATKRSEKREAAKEFRQNLEKMPTVKNIFDNIKSIFAQLEAEGIITKSKDCP